MGSCLEFVHSGAGQPIWTEDFLGNYRRIVRQTAVLKYNGTAASAPRLLEYFYKVNRLWRTELLRRLLRYLRRHKDFNHESGLVEFPYDWRESIAETARKLGVLLNAKLGVSVQDETPAIRLTIVTHSMGALVARVALVDGHVNPKIVKRLVHIAPPLKGSASAFRNRFELDLPFLSDFVTFCQGQKNGDLALENLRDAVSTFPSIYELMPPVSERFLYVGSGTNVSPFEPAQVVFSASLKSQASSLHNKILRSMTTLKSCHIPVTTIYGVNAARPTDVAYKVFVEGTPSGYEYEILPPIPHNSTSYGDGTVTERSCSYDSSDPADLRAVVGEIHHLMCQSKNTVAVLATVL